jgi:hypothetical protein
MVIAMGEVPLDLFGCRHTQCLGINWIERLAVVGVLVGQDHRRPSVWDGEKILHGLRERRFI